MHTRQALQVFQHALGLFTQHVHVRPGYTDLDIRTGRSALWPLYGDAADAGNPAQPGSQLVDNVLGRAGTRAFPLELETDQWRDEALDKTLRYRFLQIDHQLDILAAQFKAIEIDKGDADVGQQGTQLVIGQRLEHDLFHLRGQLGRVFQAVGLRRLGIDKELPQFHVVKQLERQARGCIGR